jgi:excisionase family DNA binding protein
MGSRMGRSKWKKTALEATRPPANGRVLVSREETLDFDFAENINPWERIAASIEKLAAAFTPKVVDEPVVPKVFTPAEAAKVMRVNVQTVMEWCRTKRLTAYKVGRRWLIPVEAVNAYLRGQEVRNGK